MKILLNATGAVHGTSATARYVRNLVRWLPVISQADNITAFEFWWRRRPFSLSMPKPVDLKTIIWPMPPRIGETIFRWAPFFGVGFPICSFDLVHQVDPSPIECRARRRVCTIHQASLMQRPELFLRDQVEAFHAWLYTVRTRASLLIAVSENMRQTLINDFCVPVDRIVAIPLGIDPHFSPLNNDINRKSPQGWPYLLYVGRINRCKNVKAVCEAFSRIALRHKDLHLVLIGWLDVPQDVVYQEWLPDARLRERLHIHPPLDPDGAELPNWYRGASVFIFPSLAEGWTSPPLEAMACGVPVVTSNVSSLPETVGDAALQVDPMDNEALANSIEKLLTDASLRAIMINRGLIHAAQYTWESTARKTINAYHCIL